MSATTMQTGNTKTAPISNRKLLWAGPAAGIAAAIANVIVFLIATGLFSMPLTMPNFAEANTFAPLPLGAVIASCIIGGIGGAVALALIARFSARPVSTFQVVALVVLVLSFALVVTLPAEVETSTKIVLGIMHSVAGAVIIVMLPRLARNT